jgi:hypothetical protein
MIDEEESQEQAPDTEPAGDSMPPHTLFPSDDIHPFSFTSPFINPDFPTDHPEDDNDEILMPVDWAKST